jgi:hypothetical protein
MVHSSTQSPGVGVDFLVLGLKLNIMKKLIVLCFAWVLVQVAKADSPLTSTNLSLGYESSKWVTQAKTNTGPITGDLVKFLAGKGDLGEKLAVICTLGWGDNAATNAFEFSSYLAKNKPAKKRTADDYCCLAYLQALGNYFEVKEAGYTAELAVEKNPNSFCCQIIWALIKAQQYLHNNTWCEVFKVCEEVRINTTFKQDMKPEAVKGIFDYINIYQEECKN